MKNLLLFTLCIAIIPSFTYGQSTNAPDGAAGLKYAMSVSEVKSAWKAKGAPAQDFTLLKPGLGSIIYHNVMVGTQTFDLCVLKFVNNKLYELNFCKIPERDAFAQPFYDNLQEILTKKYGEGHSYRNFKGIYSDGDGYEMQAVRLGYASIATYWSFNDISTISIEIKPLADKITVMMVYQSNELFEEVDKILQNVNTNDF